MASVVLANILVDWIWPLLLFIIGLGLVIFVHELGHFLVAKWSGIKVERFALGFGPNVFAFKRGETEYCLKVFPLGGYVKMLGQEDFKPMEAEEKPDPRAYNAKSISVRLAVISAGVVMNVIFGAILFIVVCMVGIKFPAPVLGRIMADSPADKAIITWSEPMSRPKADGRASTNASQPASLPANQTEGLMPGDRIVSINGKPVVTFQDIAVKSILAGKDDKFRFEIESKSADGKTVIGTATLGVKQTDVPGNGRINTFGVEPCQSITFGTTDEVVTNNGIQSGDVLYAINGQRVEHNWQIGQIEKTLDGRPVIVTVLRNISGKSEKVDLKLQPSVKNSEQFIALKDGRIIRGSEQAGENGKETIEPEGGGTESVSPDDIARENLDILGMVPRTEVRAVLKGSPAFKVGIKPGDIIVDYAEKCKPPTMGDFHEINKEAVKDDGRNITILRGKDTLAPMIIKPEQKKNGDPIIGILTCADVKHCVVAGVRKDSAAAKARIEPGDTITAINDKPVESWADLLDELPALCGKKVTLTYTRGENKAMTADIGILTSQIYQPKDYRVDLFYAAAAFEDLQVTVEKYNPLDAIAWGVSETWGIIVKTYASIHRLITGDVSTEAVRGPIGVGSAAIMTVRHSFIHLVYLMAFLSVAVAVMNFLPFPVFDGGHAFFLILEKIRGKALPIKVMNIIQMVGLIMILGLLVLITWQDLARAIRGHW